VKVVEADSPGEIRKKKRSPWRRSKANFNNYMSAIHPRDHTSAARKRRRHRNQKSHLVTESIR
jgi:hypothetical protein